MRILAGKYKFKKIIIYKNIKFNPISSFLRSNIFNLLQNNIKLEDSIVVDLFSGTGSLGLESLSRDSKFVYFNDINIKNCKRIEEILNSLNDKNSEVDNLSYLQFLLKLKQLNIKINLLFLDPPYKEKEIILNILEILDNENLMKENGIIVITSPIKRNFINKFKNFELTQEKKYGKNFIYFLNYRIKKIKIKTNEFNNSKILIISGPSGVGKKQIIKNLIDNEELNLSFSISITTRKPRINEINGKDYDFISVDQFKTKIKSGDFLEYAKFIENYYGTSKTKIKELINKKKNVLLEIEIEGALKIKEQIPNAIWVFIFPPTLDELKKRLKKRATENQEQIKERLEKALEEIRFITTNNKCDLQIINDEIDITTEKITIFLKEIFKNEN